MKGFGIEIKNNLLEHKHHEAMGDAVWLYMWLLDKMTSISEEGVGKILGGKPIKYEEVKEELSMSERTYNRWIAALKKHEYVNVRRTPYGLVLSVNKAHKRFGNRSAKNGVSEKAKEGGDPPETQEEIRQNGGSNKTEQYKTEQKDSGQSPLVPELIDGFKEVNPSYGKWFGNKTQRAAADRLISIHGLEQCLKVIKILPQSNRLPYLPTITTPVQLEDKWAQLEAGLIKKKGAAVTSGRGIA